MQLAEKGTVRVSDLSDYLKMALPGVIHVGREMEEKDLLVKIPNPSDRRVVELEPTEKLLRLSNTVLFCGKCFYQERIDIFSRLAQQNFSVIVIDLRRSFVVCINNVKSPLSFMFLL